jgi:hypothetical protein
MAFAGLWPIKTVLKHKKSVRARFTTLAVIAGLQIVPIVAGFSIERDAEYPFRGFITLAESIVSFGAGTPAPAINTP